MPDNVYAAILVSHLKAIVAHLEQGKPVKDVVNPLKQIVAAAGEMEGFPKGGGGIVKLPPPTLLIGQSCQPKERSGR